MWVSVHPDIIRIGTAELVKNVLLLACNALIIFYVWAAFMDFIRILLTNAYYNAKTIIMAISKLEIALNASLHACYVKA